jgi:carboxypeptidase PM20D1
MRRIFRLSVASPAILLLLVVGSVEGLWSDEGSTENVQTVAVDSDAVIRRFASSIQHRTISHEDPADFDPAPFRAFHSFLEKSFPRVHQSLRRERVADYSLLYTWPGTDPELQPVLLMAHIDVVPIEPGTEEQWEHPPFDGIVSGGFLWGRGTFDDKASLMASLEAVETLLALGFAPRRTLYLAFGHDEEVHGIEGAKAIAGLLADRGVRLLYTLDEGMGILEGSAFGIVPPAAIIGLAEKGFVSLKLRAKSRGGHSSTPPATTSVGTLARAIARLEDHPMPTRLSGPGSLALDALAGEMSFFPRLVIRNRWLFGRLLVGQLESTPATNALIRTTIAPTIVHGGLKENVLPSEAYAIVNFRILQGDTIESVTAHVRRVIDEPNVEVEPYGRFRIDPSPVSRGDGPGFLTIRRSIQEVFPDALVAPGLVLGGTDSKHYVDVSEDSYRFVPLRASQDDLKRIHGTNERIAVDDYVQIIKFYGQLIRNAAS